MYEYFDGVVAEKVPGRVVVDVGGVGYLLDISTATSDMLPAKGAKVKLFAHYHVREDAHKLYGFHTSEERDVFRLLLSISQIGPKVALGVLSAVAIADLAYAVGTQDVTKLKGVPGIGPKTAQRLVMELKGKIQYTGEGKSPGTALGTGGGPASSVERDAHAAMVSLGYSEAQVVRALTRVREVVGEDAVVEEWIRKALQVI